LLKNASGGVSAFEETILGRHFWAIGYGAWSTGNITDEMVQQYLEHHRQQSNGETDTFILD
jgi:putative transposase